MRSEPVLLGVNLVIGLAFSTALTLGPSFSDRSVRWSNPAADMGLLLMASGLAFRTALVMRRAAPTRWQLQAATLLASALAVLGVNWVIP